MQIDSSALFKAAETTGDAFLQLCQILHSQGANLAEDSTMINHISLELQKLLGTTPIPTPTPATTVITKAAAPDLVTSAKSGILRLDDPCIAEISSLRILQDLKQSVRIGNAREKYPVGTIIPDLWANPDTGIIYLMPLRIVHHGPVMTANEHCRDAAILLRVNASPNKLMFGIGQNADIYENENVFAVSYTKSWHNDKEGYLKGCSPNLLSAVAEIIVDNVPVKFFLPSLEELHFFLYVNPELERLTWEYFRDTPDDIHVPCPKRIFRDPSGTAQACSLRSPCRGNSCRVWAADTDGSASTNDTILTSAYAPACAVIG